MIRMAQFRVKLKQIRDMTMSNGETSCRPGERGNHQQTLPNPKLNGSCCPLPNA